MAYGDAPKVIRGLQENYKRLFYSEYDQALMPPVTITAGHGILKPGTALAFNLSAAGNVGKAVPYNPTTFTGTEDHPGRLYAVASIASGESTVDVTIDDSYKLIVGDDLIVNETGQTAQNCGAITGIDVTTYTNRAVITFTTACTNGAATGNSAYVCAEAGVSSNNYSDCIGILATAVDTGEGINSVGAQAPVIISHAILYTGMLVNFDAAAIADMSATTFGQYSVLK